MNPKSQNGLIGIVAKCITQKPLVCMYVCICIYVHMCMYLCICTFIYRSMKQLNN